MRCFWRMVMGMGCCARFRGLLVTRLECAKTLLHTELPLTLLRLILRGPKRKIERMIFPNLS